jgi:hypothetical protein
MAGPLRTFAYGTPLPPALPRIADLPHLPPDHYGHPAERCLTVVFTDGSRLDFNGIKTEDWDYGYGAAVLTVQKGKTEHAFPLARILYMRWQEP